MIVLDATVVIAHLDSSDLHHAQASAVLESVVDEDLRISPITLAECYTGPARKGLLERARSDIRRLEISIVPLDDSAPERLATLRAHTRLRMPDCCVLLAAHSVSAEVATFDTRLANAATSLGLSVRD